ncbi:hypothetical protein [Telmatospirillum sp. J64-1]|uniref:hypothetical protein n=1 Tax=Telmatospirillum sp. J64-1 TaxID=2502183 RepID=UPI00115DC406|nr:hypothetical protein [Telmatospirillum sp. J64-1]
MQQLMGQAEFARLLSSSYGVKMTRQAVSKSNVIPKQAGKIPVARALAALEAAGKLTLERQEAEAAPELPLAASSAPASAPKLTGERGYYAEKALTEAVDREIKELKLAELKGELLRVADVTEAMVSAGKRICDKLGGLVVLADELSSAAIAGGVDAVREVLRRELRILQISMAEDMKLMAEEAGREEGEEDDAT